MELDVSANRVPFVRSSAAAYPPRGIAVVRPVVLLADQDALRDLVSMPLHLAVCIAGRLALQQQFL